MDGGRPRELGPGDIVLDGDPAPPKGHSPPIFVQYLLWPNDRPSQLLLSSCIILIYIPVRVLSRPVLRITEFVLLDKFSVHAQSYSYGQIVIASIVVMGRPLYFCPVLSPSSSVYLFSSP